MKATVVNRFKDKNTKVLHEVGETIEVNDKRFGEINSASYLTLLEEIKELNYLDLSKKELTEIAENRKIEINSKMTKAEIIEELMK